MLRGLSEDAGRRIAAERDARGPFRSLADLTTRTRLGQAVVKLLADADAFASLALDRRTALWQALDQPRTAEPLPLFDALPADDDAPLLPTLSPQQQVFADYLAVGLTLREHPLVGDAQTCGMMGALQLVQDKARGTAFPAELEVGMVCRGHCFREGLIMRAVGDRMIVAPPLVMTTAQLDEMVALIRRCLDLTLDDASRQGWLS